jgi:hypothetical protein
MRAGSLAHVVRKRRLHIDLMDPLDPDAHQCSNHLSGEAADCSELAAFRLLTIRVMKVIR